METPLREGPVIRIRDEVKSDLLLDLEEADRLGQQLIGIATDHPPGSVLVIDLSEVRTRASCAARFLGDPLRSIQTKSLADRYLVVQGPLDSNEKDVELALRDEGLVAIVREAQGPRLIGKVDPVVGETYGEIVKKSRVTSSMLTDPPLGLKLTTANARLDKLHNLGLVHRLETELLESGGRRFVYQPIR